MNTLVMVGIWMLCGGVMSYLVYVADERKCDREEIYRTNLYIIFMVIFWPIAAYFFFRFLIVAIVSRKSGGGNG